MSIKVFLADDHPVVRDGLRYILETQADITVVGEAANGLDALAQAQKLRPDVLVMDISMPGLNGIEATRRIREELPRAQVVILSVYSTAEHIYRALKAGAQGYLLKESAGAEVVKAVRTVYEGRRYLCKKISDIVIDNYVRRRETVEPKSPLERLSLREREVLQWVVEGKSSKEIANIIHLSPKSVETYRSRLMQKLGVHDLASLVKFAIQHGLTPPE
jgi:DNA-binding NarL/FixJ family response regulator